MKRVFLDANILIEVLMDRNLAEQCLTMLEADSVQYGISALTVHIVCYIGEKYKLERARIDDILSAWEILPVTAHTIRQARNQYDGKDFEDCLQAACAEEAEYDQILTIDKRFQQHSGTALPVFIISELLPGDILLKRDA